MTELEWLSRAKTDTTETAKRKHWDSRCKRYRVTLSKSLFGLPDRSYSLVRNAKGGFDLLKMHCHYRHTESAFNECEQHWRKNQCANNLP